MCGIVGIVRLDGSRVDPARIQAMTKTLVHRGPDDEGMLVEGPVGLGMRRLSIIDLSAAGHQPLENETKTVSVVYNGEIYNYRDIRSRLELSGHTFRGHSDTEVLVHGYEDLGIDGLAARLSGMFAFALLDRARRRLFLVRDGFGIKPLYLRRVGPQLSFASELRALAVDGAGSLSADGAFLHTFLRVGYVMSPRSGFSGVTRVDPGSIVEIDLHSGRSSVRSFYRLAPQQLDELDTRALLERLRELLNASVRRHLIADVPTGVFLSGGLDSSALTIFANHHIAPPKTFSIGFTSSDRGDETQTAAIVARRAGNQNIRIDLAAANLEDLAIIAEAMEEPVADSAVLPLWYLCQGTAADVKVALSGEGGDEVLGGYARYFWGPVVDELRPMLAAKADRIRSITGHLPSRSSGLFNVSRRAAKLADSIDLHGPARYLSWFDIFTSEERRALIGAGPDEASARFETLFEEAERQRLDPVQTLQYVDIRTMLLDNLLVKADKLSMAHSLEVRIPFLSRELVEFGLGLPAHQKTGPMRNKRLLRTLLEPLLGADITRRPKRGFEIPVDLWFREKATEPTRARLTGGALVSKLGFSRKGIETLVTRHRAGVDVGRKLFALTALEYWAQRFA